MKTVSKSFQRIALLSLFLFLSFSSLHLNAGSRDDEETEEEGVIVTTPTSKPSALTARDYEKIGNEYDILIKNWAEHVRQIDPTELPHLLDLPDLHERTLNKIGYFPFLSTYFPSELSEKFPTLHNDIENTSIHLQQPIAQFNLGWMLALGQGGVEQNIIEAFIYYQKAAEQNMRLDQYICGGLYHQMKLHTEALFFIEKAANQDLAIAQYALGVRFINNDKQQEGEALLRKAALQGLPNAQYALGTYLIYVEHPIDGEVWLEAANAQGFSTKCGPIAQLKGL